MRIYEIHYQDLYPQTFEQFRQKYAQVDPTGLYVNFNDHVGNTLDRSFSPKPTHHDPAGLYAYPLEYVLNHPADIAYGQQAAYLRVIRDTSRNKLVLNDLTQEQALALLARMRIDDGERRMAQVQKKFKYFGGNVVAKRFLGVIQQYRHNGQTTTTSNRDQSLLFLKAGIDAVEDRAASAADAVIYPDEPEQIVFLRRDAFQVVEVFTLRPNRKADSQSLNARNFAERLRRLPALVAAAIGDRLRDSNTTGERHEEQVFYTVAGRKIVVKVIPVRDYGGKSHRVNAGTTQEPIEITLMGEFRPIIAEYGGDMSFEAIARDMAERFAQRRPTARNRRFDLETEQGADVQTTLELLQGMARKLKMPFTPPKDFRLAFLIHQSVQAMENGMSGFATEPMTKKAEKLVAANDTYWARQRSRPVQADQIQALWLAAMKKRGFAGYDPFFGRRTTLASAAEFFGVKPSTAPTVERTKLGDLEVGRVGTQVTGWLNGKEHPLGPIDGLKWTPAYDLRDTTLVQALRTHSQAMADFLNDQQFYSPGYIGILANTFDLFYDPETKEYMPFRQAVTKTDTYGDFTFLFTPEWIFLETQGSYTPQHVPGEPDGPRSWHEVEPFIQLDGNTIKHISKSYETFLNTRRNPSQWQPVRWGDADQYGRSGRWEQTIEMGKMAEASGFNLKEFAEKHHLVPGPHLDQRYLQMLGYMVNRDTGTVGKTTADIAQTVGTFAGKTLYSVGAEHGTREFFIKAPADPYGYDRRETLNYLFTGLRDYRNGSGLVKLSRVNTQLTDDDRRVIGDFLSQHGEGVPKDWRKWFPKKSKA